MTSMYENATPRPWRASIWPSSGQSDTVCIYARGDDEIIGWNGFDGVPCTKVEIRANAKLIVHAVNNIERLEAINAELLEALELLVGSLADQDDEGLIEHAEPMVLARAAIASAQRIIGEEMA